MLFQPVSEGASGVHIEQMDRHGAVVRMLVYLWLRPMRSTAIAEIWTQLIQPAGAIGRNDNFFEIGGHSLLALRALRKMEHKLGVKLELHVLILDHLADIAIRCQSKRAVQGTA